MFDEMIAALHADDTDDIDDALPPLSNDEPVPPPTLPEPTSAVPLNVAAPQSAVVTVAVSVPAASSVPPPAPSITPHDAMIPTNLNAPSASVGATAAPMNVSRPQQAISAVALVQPTKTPDITATVAVQATPPPKTAGGNLVLQGAGEQPTPATQLPQSQTTPQALTPVSWLKPGA